MTWHKQPHEPKHMIHLESWRAALARLSTLADEPRNLLADLMAHVDAGWKHVRRLQHVHEEYGTTGAQSGALRDVLAFMDDVVDTFRGLVFDTAELVPGWEGWSQAADPGEMDGDAGEFMRYLSVLRLASESAELPVRIGEVTASVRSGLEGWEAEFTRLLRIIDKVVILPGLSEQDRDFIPTRVADG